MRKRRAPLNRIIFSEADHNGRLIDETRGTYRLECLGMLPPYMMPRARGRGREFGGKCLHSPGGDHKSGESESPTLVSTVDTTLLYILHHYYCLKYVALRTSA